MIADAQALTDNADNPEKVCAAILLKSLLDYLACGLDPEKSTLLSSRRFRSYVNCRFII